MTDKPIKIGVNCLVVKDGKVLMGKRLGKAGSGSWGYPGGHLEWGEHLEDAAKRELLEETGLRASEMKFVQVVNGPRPEDHYLQIQFLVTKWEGQPENREPEKCEGWEWLDLKNLPENIFFSHEKFHLALTEGIDFIS